MGDLGVELSEIYAINSDSGVPKRRCARNG